MNDTGITGPFFHCQKKTKQRHELSVSQVSGCHHGYA